MDFRLECSWIDGELFGKADQGRIDCIGVAMFMDVAPTEGYLAQVQKVILDDEASLSNNISDQLGQPAQINQVIIEMPIEERETVDDDVVDEKERETASNARSLVFASSHICLVSLPLYLIVALYLL